MDLKAIVRRYIKEDSNNVPRRYVNSMLKYEGDDKEIKHDKAIGFLNELTDSIKAVTSKFNLTEKQAAQLLIEIAMNTLHNH